MSEVLHERGLPTTSSRHHAVRELTGLELVEVSAWSDTSRAVGAALAEITGVHPAARPNRVASLGDIRILSVAPHRWLISAHGPSRSHVASEIRARIGPETAAVVDLSAARCVYVLAGPDSRRVLAKALPIDVSEEKFGTGDCAQSAMWHVGVLVHGLSQDTFELYVPRSFASHFFEMLMDAGLEFGWAGPDRDAPGAGDR